MSPSDNITKRLSMRVLLAGALLLLVSSFADGEVCQVFPNREQSQVLEATAAAATAAAATSTSGNQLSSTTSPSMEDQLLNCPGPNDPANHTACCYDYEDGDELYDEEESLDSLDEDENNSTETLVTTSTTTTTVPKIRRPRCCALKFESKQSFLDWVISLDDRICRVAMIVALSVTGTLLLFTIIVIVCCFWSQCPLYTTCRTKYDKDDIIATAGDEETANLTDMPAEEKSGVKGYSPNEVKVTTLNEEEEPCLKKEKDQEEQQPLVEKKEEKKEDKKKDDKKKEDKKKEKEEEKKKKEEEKKKKEEEKKKKEEEKKKKEEEKKKKDDDKKKDDKKKEEKKDEKKEEEVVEKKEEKKEEVVEKKPETEEKEKKEEEPKEETK